MHAWTDPPLSDRESKLLRRIEFIIPLAALQQRKALSTIGKQRELSDAEMTELSRLTEEIEIAEAQRIDLLSELARLRGISLPQLMLRFERR